MDDSTIEIIERFENILAGRRAMKEINLIDRVLDSLENGNFISTKGHLNRDELGSYLVTFDYDVNEMTDTENRDLLPDICSHLNDCLECYEKVERACDIIKKGLYNLRMGETRRN